MFVSIEKTTALVGVDEIQKSLEESERIFQDKVEDFSKQTEILEKDISNLNEKANCSSVSDGFKGIDLKDSKDQLDKHIEELERSARDIKNLFDRSKPDKHFQNKFRKNFKTIISKFESKASTVESLEAKYLKMQERITHLKKEFKNTNQKRIRLEDIIDAQKKIVVSVDFKNIKNDLENIRSISVKLAETYEYFRKSMKTFENNFRRIYLERINFTQEQKEECQKWEKAVEDMRIQNSSYLERNEQIEKDIENVHSRIENERKDFEIQKKIKVEMLKDLEIQYEEKVEKNKQVSEMLYKAETYRNSLATNCANLENELSYLDKDHELLNEKIQVLEKEKMILNRKATEIEIQKAVESALEQQYCETKRLHEIKLSQITQTNDELKKVLAEKKLRNEEMRKNRYGNREKEKIEMEKLQAEYKEALEVHSATFPNGVTGVSSEIMNLFGVNLNILDPVIEQILAMNGTNMFSTTQIPETENQKNNK